MIETVALGAFKAMLLEYDRAYGPYGYETCRRLKHDLAELTVKAEKASAVIASLHDQLAQSQALIKGARRTIDDLREKYNKQLAIVAARDGGVKEIDPDPYADPDTPSPPERSPADDS